LTQIGWQGRGQTAGGQRNGLGGAADMKRTEDNFHENTMVD